MAKTPAGKSPPPRKSATKKPAAPKKAVGSVAPARKSAAKARAAQKKDVATDAPQLGLKERRQDFVNEFLVDLNATQAAIRAGYSPETAGQIGHELLKKPEIQLAISEARKSQQERTQITADRALREAWSIATADARELVELYVGACRYCHGEGHRYHRTLTEFNKARESWLEEGKDPAEFDEMGGIGFNPLAPPHHECPECAGAGWPRQVVKDTRRLSPAAAALYAGTKLTKDGLQIQMHSKLDALEKVFKHLGLYEQDNKQKADALATLLHTISGGNNSGFQPVADDPERATKG